MAFTLFSQLTIHPTTNTRISHMLNQRTRRLVPASLLLAALALTGCQTYTQQTATRDAAVRSGDLATAVAQADRDAERNKDNKDTILYRLEQGIILRSAALANLPLPIDPKAQAPSLIHI